MLIPRAEAEQVALQLGAEVLYEKWRAAEARVEAAVNELRRERSLRLAAEQALAQAIAEIEGSPYQSEPWGWGIANRIESWRALALREETT